MFIRQRTRLGPIDDTGNSAFDHLHFSIHDSRRGGMSVQPTPMDGQTLNDGDAERCLSSTNVPNLRPWPGPPGGRRGRVSRLRPGERRWGSIAPAGALCVLLVDRSGAVRAGWASSTSRMRVRLCSCMQSRRSSLRPGDNTMDRSLLRRSRPSLSELQAAVRAVGPDQAGGGEAAARLLQALARTSSRRLPGGHPSRPSCWVVVLDRGQEGWTLLYFS